MFSHGQRIAYSLFFSFLALIGFATNSAIISVILLTRSMRKTCNFYLVSVALSDLLLCGVTCSFNAYSVTTEKIVHGCEFIALFICCLMLVSFISLTAIAVNRALMMNISNVLYDKLFSHTRTIVSLIIAWIASTVLGIYPMFYSNGYVPSRMQPYRLCIVETIIEENYVIDTIFLLSIVIVGTTTTLISYYIVFRRANSLKRKHRQFRVTRNLFAVTIVYVVCWLPYLLLVIADRDQKVPDLIRQIFLLIFFSHAVINPILYLALHNPLRRAIGRTLQTWNKRTTNRISVIQTTVY